MTRDEAARQLFEAVAAFMDALYWPGDNTAYVHGATYLPLQAAWEALAQAYEWPLPESFFPLKDEAGRLVPRHPHDEQEPPSVQDLARIEQTLAQPFRLTDE